jgi:hypothetical protein
VGVKAPAPAGLRGTDDSFAVLDRMIDAARRRAYQAEKTALMAAQGKGKDAGFVVSTMVW